MRGWGLWEVLKSGGQSLMNGISAWKRGSREFPCPFYLWGHSDKAPALNKEEGLHQNVTMSGP